MDVVVCLKRVPEVAEVDLQVDPTGKRVKTEGLPFVLNDWDSYALEEAVRIKERMGAKVTAVTVGGEEDEEVLRRALALGADQAIRISDPRLQDRDAFAIARVLAQLIKDLPHDLILVGVQAADDGYAQVGPTLAELLGIPHATLVTSLELEGGKARVRRELEAGLEEVLEVELPALFSIQSGINEPRYVSILGIRRVAKKEIKVLGLEALGLEPEGVRPKVLLERLFSPPVGEGAEIITGGVEEVAERVAEIFERGGVI